MAAFVAPVRSRPHRALHRRLDPPPGAGYPARVIRGTCPRRSASSARWRTRTATSSSAASGATVVRPHALPLFRVADATTRDLQGRDTGTIAILADVGEGLAATQGRRPASGEASSYGRIESADALAKLRGAGGETLLQRGEAAARLTGGVLTIPAARVSAADRQELILRILTAARKKGGAE